MATRASQTFDAYFLGMLQRHSPRAQDPGYVDQALNVVFRGGAIQGRPGFRPFNGIAFDGAVRGIHFHVKDDGSRELLAGTKTGAIQRCILGGDPETLPLTNLPLNDQTRVDVNKVNFLSLSGGGVNNTTFIFDGVNTNLKYDGENLTKMGVPNGPTPVDPVVAAGVVPNGRYRWVITLKSGASSHEGDISVVYREVTNTAGPRNFTFASPVQTPGAPVAANNEYDDPQVTSWLLWRTIKDGADYFFIGQADIGDDITDNTPNEDIDGSDPVEELRNGPPQAPIVAMVEHRNQMIAIMSDDRTVLRFSNFDPDYMVPEGWPRLYAQPVSVGDGDEVTAMRSLNEWCLVFKQNASYAITGESYELYKLVPLIAGAARQGVGCNFPGSVFQVDNSVFFAGRDGFYRIDREGELTAGRISNAIDDLYSAVNFSLTSSAFYDRKKRMIVWLAHG